MHAIMRDDKGRFIKGEHPHNWNGGKWVDLGYLRITKPNDEYILEHRLVMEKHLGRKLLRSEIVHHINGDKLDNRIDNLQLMTQGQHIKIHLTKDMSDRVCTRCNRNKTHVTKKGHQRWYRHPITKQWLCNGCISTIKRRLKRQSER